MSNREPQGVVWVCTDCMLTHHGYDAHELGHTPDRDPWSLWDDEEITAGMLREEHAEDCDPAAECDCETDQFSWKACEGCGSPLGGERHAFTNWA